MNHPLQNPKMRASDFLVWSEAQPEGRYELVEGEVVMMTPERARHNLTKFAAAQALRDAVARAGLRCTVFADGIAVKTTENTIREPDASVQFGVKVDLNSMLNEQPVIVVEVVFPSSERTDAVHKLEEYFAVASIHHYLIVHAEKRTLIQHARSDGGEIRTRILGDGVVNLSPPGLAIKVSDFFIAEDIEEA